VWQYKECVDAGGCATPATGIYCNWGVPGREWHPINCVNWHEAVNYADWKDQQDPVLHIRLPSEAEWEYIAKSLGQDNPYPWGFDVPTCDFAQFRDVFYGCGLKTTSPVCRTSTTLTPRQAILPNGDTTEGVCDMSGNVSEWTLDYFSRNYFDSFTDARPFLGSTDLEEVFTIDLSDLQITRGGSWTMSSTHLKTTSRGSRNRNLPGLNEGIRLVASFCGNGIIEGDEECDDGNHSYFDQCDFFCKEQ
jgi:iron(II)-dependent oxidoreductase